MKKQLLLIATLFASCLSWAQAPKADLIDLVFNADGTATDISALANPVEAIGTPKVVKSTQYDMNVFCAKQNTWFSDPYTAFRVEATDAIMTAIQDGMTIEVMLRPYSASGSLPNGWGNAFGFEQGGGSGLLIEDGTWRFETRSNGSYHTAVWTQDPVMGEWVHLVGVWNQEAGKAYIYANGELVGETDATGEYGFPNAQYIFCGCDVTSSNNGEHSIPGDYAYFRMYSDPLTAEQVAAVYAEIKTKDTGAEEHNETDDRPSYEVDEDGTMLISTAEDLYNFGVLTKTGQVINAKLVNDIDYTAYNSSLSTDANRLRGTFDGQGHTIKIDMHPSYADAGLFDATDSGSFILNLHVDGNMSATSDWSGVLIGDDYGATIENVLITAEFTTTDDDNTMGGLLAGYNNGNPHYKNVVCIGSVYSEVATACCGIVADIKGQCTMENCVAVVDIKNVNRADCNPIYSRIRGSLTCKNVSYVNVNNEEYDLVAGINEISMEDVTSGKICAMLANGDVNTVWRQTVGTDETPNMQSDHGFVIKIGEEYVGVTEANLASTCAQIQTLAQNSIEEADANAELLAQYSTVVELLASSQTMTDFYTYYPQYLSAQHEVEINAEAYATFQKAVADALEQLGTTEGSIADKLRDYLSEYIEPGDDYADGSAPYIIENKSQTNEGLTKQTEYINDMLKRVAATAVEAGTEVTVLLANADFSEGSRGWTGTTPNKTSTEPNAIQYYGKKTVNLSQTITGLKNGVYEFDLNALYEVNDIMDNSLSNAVVFANDVEVPVVNIIEGALPFEDAEDGVNCFITDPGTYPYDDMWDDESYVPTSMQGGAIALNGGRYLNRVLANVTDGKLTVGVRMDGSGSSKDWLLVANARLVYQGEIAEATQSIGDVLTGMAARATNLVNFEARTSTEEYPYYPNYSAATRAALKAAAEQAATDKTYELAQTFTKLFKQAYAERKAYKVLADNLEEYFGSASDYPELSDQIQSQYDATWLEWIDGVYSAAEAEAKGKALLAELDNVDVEVPAADLLDVVFNADGTATDKSAAANVITADGTPRIVKSAEYDMNVFCAASNLWSKNPTSNYRFTMTDELWAGISNGVTFEVLVRPYWEGDYNSTWISVLGYEQTGGIGMITDGGKWCFEAHVGGGYKDAYGDMPVKDDWIHLVGVWNQEEGNIALYQNGRSAGTANAGGELQAPSTVKKDMFIGCDLDGGNGNGQNSFQGDIAIVRIYDQPLSGPQARKLYKQVQALNTGATEHDESDPDAVQSIRVTPAASQAIYNLMGQKLTKAQRGINIINGKKLFVK